MKPTSFRVTKASIRRRQYPYKLQQIHKRPHSTALATDEFDLCVLGAGSGGIAGAVRGWDYGKKVAVISPLAHLGGATIHDGALSSKVMWQLSRQNRHLRSVYPDHVSSWQSMKNRVQESIDIKSTHYLRQLTGLKQESMQEAIRYSGDETGGGGDIHLIDGKARFLDKHTVEVVNPNNNEPLRKIRSQYFLVSTGSSPRSVISKGDFYVEADGEYILTSDDVLSENAMSDFPESLLIYGAGVIGCEFATIFSNYGVTKNIILFNEGRDRLLPREDMDVSQFLTDTLQHESKVTVANKVVMKRMEIEYAQKRVKCTFYEQETGSESVVYVEKVLIAAGRIPNTSTLHLPGNVCDIESNGKVKVDNHLRLVGGDKVDCSNIYFCGDALGTWGLVSVAEMEARHGVEYMFGSKNPITRLEYDDISSVMFVRPEISSVGMNELECQKRGIAYKCALLRLGLVTRSVIDWNERNASAIQPKLAGFIKMIVTDDEDRQLLGVRCVGVNSSSTIQAAAMVIRRKESVREIEKLCHAHPAINESVQECARLLLGRSIFKPHTWPRSYVRHWSPEKGQVFAEEVIPKRFRQIVPGYGFY